MSEATFCRNNTTGSALAATLVILGLLSVMLAAYLGLTTSESKLTARQIAWKSSLSLAEAGVEEAMTHLNRSSNSTADGWQPDFVAALFRKNRTLGDGYFVATITFATPPTVTVTGYSLVTAPSNYVARTVQVNTRLSTGWGGIMVRDKVQLRAAGILDSFNSEDPSFSTAGLYDPAKSRDNCFVGTLSGDPGNLYIGNHLIYGKAGCAPGGDIALGNGKVGSKAWIQSSLTSGKVEDGHFVDDVNLVFADPVVPFKSALVPGSGVVNGVPYAYVFTTGNYKMGQLSMSSSESAIVTGNATLHVPGDFKMSGSFTIAPGASFKLYLGGQDFSETGHGIVNSTGRAANFVVFGVRPGNQSQSVFLTGGSSFIGVIYMPRADVTMTGHSSATGSIYANSVSFTGNVDFHADEALGFGPIRFIITSWTEVPSGT